MANNSYMFQGTNALAYTGDAPWMQPGQFSDGSPYGDMASMNAAMARAGHSRIDVKLNTNHTKRLLRSALMLPEV